MNVDGFEQCIRSICFLLTHIRCLWGLAFENDPPKTEAILQACFRGL